MFRFLAAVHLLDLAHFCLLVDVLVSNNLCLSFNLLHSFHQATLLTRLGLLYLFAGTCVVLLDFFFLQSDLFFSCVVVPKIVLLLIFDKPTWQFPRVLVEGVPIISLVKNFSSLFFSEHFLC